MVSQRLGPPDLATFPALRNASPLEATLRRGDVLYLPCCWWHAVRGSHGRNLSLNYWFNLHPRKVDVGVLLGSLGFAPDEIPSVVKDEAALMRALGSLCAT